jgi:hypothetical protein
VLSMASSSVVAAWVGVLMLLSAGFFFWIRGVFGGRRRDVLLGGAFFLTLSLIAVVGGIEPVRSLASWCCILLGIVTLLRMSPKLRPKSQTEDFTESGLVLIVLGIVCQLLI